jgi:molybdopterin synthase sulfur carrier subunit
MKIKILNFGVARDIIGSRDLIMEVSNGFTSGELCDELIRRYPAFNETMAFSIAINLEYVRTNQEIFETDEIAIIPPVSGG